MFYLKSLGGFVRLSSGGGYFITGLMNCPYDSSGSNGELLVNLIFSRWGSQIVGNHLIQSVRSVFAGSIMLLSWILDNTILNISDQGPNLPREDLNPDPTFLL